MCLPVPYLAPPARATMPTELMPSAWFSTTRIWMPCSCGILRASFTAMQQKFLALSARYPQVDTLSMGMSTDLTTAIASGSTMVRIGTAIFGARK